MRASGSASCSSATPAAVQLVKVKSNVRSAHRLGIGSAVAVRVALDFGSLTGNVQTGDSNRIRRRLSSAMRSHPLTLSSTSAAHDALIARKPTPQT